MQSRISLKDRVFAKVIALFVIVLALAGATIALFSMLFFRRTAYGMTSLVRAQSVRAVELAAVKELDGYRDLMLSLIVDNDIRSMLLELKDDGYDSYSLTVNRMERRLRDYGGYIGEVLALTVIDDRGRMISHDKTSRLSSDSRGILTEDYASGKLKQIAKEARERQGIAFFADGRKPEGRSILHVSMAVWNYYTKENFGTVILSLDASALWRAIGSGASDRLAELFVLEENGRLVAHPNYSMTGQMMDGFPDSGELAVTKLGSYNLYLAARLDPSMYNSASLRYAGYVVPMVLAIVLVAAALCFVLLKRPLRSIRELVSEITRVTDGKPPGRVTVAFRDEIYIIAEAVNQLLARLETLSDERGRDFLRYIKESERRRLAESKTLQSQINSHFLYNTLNTISCCALEDGSPRAAEMISTLARCLRYTLDKSRETAPVKDEAEWIGMYLELQKERQPSLFNYEIKLSPSAAGLPILKMLLQPFLENAILHGFAGCGGGRLITVRIGRLVRPERIFISIEDDGVGIPEDKLREIQYMLRHCETADALGIGIENVCFRLMTRYRSEARIFIRRRPGGGTKVNLLLPAVVSASRPPVFAGSKL